MPIPYVLTFGESAPRAGGASEEEIQRLGRLAWGLRDRPGEAPLRLAWRQGRRTAQVFSSGYSHQPVLAGEPLADLSGAGRLGWWSVAVEWDGNGGPEPAEVVFPLHQVRPWARDVLHRDRGVFATCKVRGLYVDRWPDTDFAWVGRRGHMLVLSQRAGEVIKAAKVPGVRVEPGEKATAFMSRRDVGIRRFYEAPFERG